jgi:hypothetical protein
MTPGEYRAYLEDLLLVTNKAYEKDPW